MATPHPFTGYNKQASTCDALVGNWVEERALLASTGVHRYKVRVSHTGSILLLLDAQQMVLLLEELASCWHVPPGLLPTHLLLLACLTAGLEMAVAMATGAATGRAFCARAATEWWCGGLRLGGCVCWSRAG